MNFTGKTALITGACSGIGAATALQFAKLGAALVLNGKDDADALKRVGEECASCGKCAPHLVVGDLSQERIVNCVWKETIGKLNKLDMLVNCAGIMPMGSIETTTLQQYDEVLAVNLRSIYQLIMLAAPELLKTQGNIVNVSGVCGLRAFPNLQAYNISKAAVDQFTRTLALELGPKGVRCNAVNPGVIATNLQRAGGMSEDEYKEFLERSKETHALCRVGEPHEVALPICFLASDQASFITGVTLPVDGGKHVMCPR